MTPEARRTDNAVPAEFVIARVLDAPRDVVWKAWTEAEQLKQWFGPKGFTMPTCRMDLRPGGVFHYCLRSPKGEAVWGRWIFREIVTSEKIVCVASFSDEQCGIAHHPMSPTWPLELLSTTTFSEKDGKTILTLKWAPLNATEAEIKTFEESRDSMKGGWTGTFEQLDDYLAKV